MSAFPNHSICLACWVARNPGREPYRLVDDFERAEACCFCATPTKDGIYVREKNERVACKTDHTKKPAAVA